MSQVRSQSGVTLLELLIAVVILAIVMSIIYQSYWLCSKSVAAAEEQSDLYQSARLALRRISDDLMGAYAPFPKPEDAAQVSQNTEEDALNGEPPVEGQQPQVSKDVTAGAESPYVFRSTDGGSGADARDSLDFTSTVNLSRGKAARAEFCQLNYAVQERERGQLALVRTSGSEASESVSIDLAPNVKGLDFRFYGADGEEYDEWDSGQSGKLPATVRVILTMSRGESKEAGVSFATAVNIPLAWERDALSQVVAKLDAERKAKAKKETGRKPGSKNNGQTEPGRPGAGRSPNPPGGDPNENDPDE